jgi:hypothetical protein
LPPLLAPRPTHSSTCECVRPTKQVVCTWVCFAHVFGLHVVHAACQCKRKSTDCGCQPDLAPTGAPQKCIWQIQAIFAQLHDLHILGAACVCSDTGTRGFDSALHFQCHYGMQSCSCLARNPASSRDWCAMLCCLGFFSSVVHMQVTYDAARYHPVARRDRHQSGQASAHLKYQRLSSECLQTPRVRCAATRFAADCRHLQQACHCTSMSRDADCGHSAAAAHAYRRARGAHGCALHHASCWRRMC